MLHARTDWQDRIVDLAGKIPEDEPVMLFRACDVNFVTLLEEYRNLLDESGADSEIKEAVERQINRAVEWQRIHPPKVPDIPQGSKL